jgi:hypothetical protein
MHKLVTHALVAAAMLSGPVAYPETLEKYVKRNIPQVMAEQERVFGMRYTDCPVVELHHAWYLGDGALYEPIIDGTKADKILLADDVWKSPFSKSDNSTPWTRSAGNAPLSAILWHELAHHYCNQASKRERGLPWSPIVLHKGFFEKHHQYPTSVPPEDREEFVSIQAFTVINEGIAVYVESYVNPVPDLFDDGMYTENLFDESTFASPDGPTRLFSPYYGGYHLVAPIIEKYGALGIDYLVTHPPRLTSLRELPAYGKRALADLDRMYDAGSEPERR